MTIINTSDRREQRKFGLVMAAAILVLGMIRWLLHGVAWAVFPAYFVIVAGVFLVLGLAAPRALQPIFVLWMKLAFVLNCIMTRVLLALAFYLMITPVRVLVRIFGEDPLKRTWLPGSESYWEPPEEQPKEFDRYRNQF